MILEILEVSGGGILFILAAVSAGYLWHDRKIFNLGRVVKGLTFFAMLLSMVAGSLMVGEALFGWDSDVGDYANVALIWSMIPMWIVFLYVHSVLIPERRKQREEQCK